MKIKSLKLEHFRQFDEFNIDFDEQLTVLIGTNGSGKTAVADSAAVAAGTFLLSIASGEQRPIAQSDVRFITEQLGSTVQVKKLFPARVSATGSVLDHADVSWERTLGSERGKTTWKGASEVASLSSSVRDRLQAISSADLTLPVIAYYGTDRLWGQRTSSDDDYETEDSRREQGYRKCLKGRALGSELLGWMRRMSFLEFQQERRVPELRAVRSAVESCCERVAGEPCEIVYSARFNDIVVKRSDGRAFSEEPLRMMSDGYRTMLGVVADIALRMARLNPQLGDGILAGTSGVVIIDEVDLHLHPIWQSRILEDLTKTFPAVQFIVTTHAPSVISSVDSRHVRILQGNTGRRPESQTYGREASSILREAMGAPTRQPSVQALFDSFYRSLDSDQFEQARSTVAELEKLIGIMDPELTFARTSLALLD